MSVNTNNFSFIWSNRVISFSFIFLYWNIWFKLKIQFFFLNCVHPYHCVLNYHYLQYALHTKKLNVYLNQSVAPKYRYKFYQHFDLYSTLIQEKKGLVLKLHRFLYMLHIQGFCHIYSLENEKHFIPLMKNVRGWRIKNWRKMRMLTI